MSVATCQCGVCDRCKHRVYMRVWRDRNRDKERAMNRAYRLRNKGKSNASRDPKKRHAYEVVAWAIHAGRLIPQPCEVCGARAQAHHDDYDKPLEVRWLCPKHHSHLHAGILRDGPTPELRRLLANMGGASSRNQHVGAAVAELDRLEALVREQSEALSVCIPWIGGSGRGAAQEALAVACRLVGSDPYDWTSHPDVLTSRMALLGVTDRRGGAA